jgi:hypothetical protein
LSWLVAVVAVEALGQVLVLALTVEPLRLAFLLVIMVLEAQKHNE